MADRGILYISAGETKREVLGELEVVNLDKEAFRLDRRLTELSETAVVIILLNFFIDSIIIRYSHFIPSSVERDSVRARPGRSPQVSTRFKPFQLTPRLHRNNRHRPPALSPVRPE